MPDLVLIGLRGSGKSTIGQRLARRLEQSFIDLDQLVLNDMKAPTVADAWATYGEPEFRKAEARLLDRVLAAYDTGAGRIIALGGGTAALPDAGRALRAARELGTARIVYLHADPDALASRIAPHDPNRPPMQGAASLDQEMRLMYEQRDPIYRDLADAIVETAIGLDAAFDAVFRLATSIAGTPDPSDPPVPPL